MLGAESLRLNLVHLAHGQQESSLPTSDERLHFGRRLFLYNKDIAASDDKDVVPKIQLARKCITETFKSALKERSLLLLTERKRIVKTLEEWGAKLGKLTEVMLKETQYAFNLRDQIPLRSSPEIVANVAMDMKLLDTQFSIIHEMRNDLARRLASPLYKEALTFYTDKEAACEKLVKSSSRDMEKIAELRANFVALQQERQKCQKSLEVREAISQIYDDCQELLLDTATTVEKALKDEESKSSLSRLKDLLRPKSPSEAYPQVDIEQYLNEVLTVKLEHDDQFKPDSWLPFWSYPFGSYKDVKTEVDRITNLTQGYVKLLQDVEMRINQISLGMGESPTEDELSRYKDVLDGLEAATHQELVKLKERAVSESANAAKHYASQQLEKGADIHTWLNLFGQLIHKDFQKYSVAFAKLCSYLSEKSDITRLFEAVQAAFAFEKGVQFSEPSQSIARTTHKMIDEIIAKVGPRALQLTTKEHLWKEYLEGKTEAEPLGRGYERYLMKGMLDAVAFSGIKTPVFDAALKKAQQKQLQVSQQFTELLALYL